jgi:hypothetical protein
MGMFGAKKRDSGSYRNITIRRAMTFFIKTSFFLRAERPRVFAMIIL